MTNDPLRTARAVLRGALLGAALWGLLALVLFGTSVWSTLGRQAVDAGVIP